MIITLDRRLIHNIGLRGPAGEALGTELWPQPAFNASTGLTLGTGWTISGGVASCNGSSSFLNTNGGNVLVNGTTYKCVVQVTIYNSGNLFGTPYDGTGTGQSTNITAVGTYTKYMTAASNAPIYIYSSGFNGTIDNVSCRQVL